MVLPPQQIPQIDRVAERYPGLRLVIDHLSMSNDIAEPFSVIKDVLTLARHKNVAVKGILPAEIYIGALSLCRVSAIISRRYSIILVRIACSGAQTWTRLPCSYRQGVTHFTEELPFLKGEDLARVMGTGICDWLGWSD